MRMNFPAVSRLSTRVLIRPALFAIGVAVMIATPSARTLGQGTGQPVAGDVAVHAALAGMAAELAAR